jgi:cytochrome c oxidase cbb3-type subunit 3
MSSFWSGWIIVLTVANIIGAVWLLWVTSRTSPGEKASDTTGHVWDGDLQEYNNPLPRWWLWLFYLTVVFSIVYLVLYPGLGNFQGVLGWSQTGQYQEERARIEARPAATTCASLEGLGPRPFPATDYPEPPERSAT